MIALLFVVVTAKEKNIEIGLKLNKKQSGLRRDDSQCVTLAA